MLNEYKERKLAEWYKICESIEANKEFIDNRYRGFGKAFISDLIDEMIGAIPAEDNPELGGEPLEIDGSINKDFASYSNGWNDAIRQLKNNLNK